MRSYFCSYQAEQKSIESVRSATTFNARPNRYTADPRSTKAFEKACKERQFSHIEN